MSKQRIPEDLPPFHLDRRFVLAVDDRQGNRVGHILSWVRPRLVRPEVDDVIGACHSPV